MEILQQLQEMDDDDDEREFSRSIVDEFREQVPEQLAIMKNHLSVALASPFISPTNRWLQLGSPTRADPPLPSRALQRRQGLPSGQPGRPFSQGLVGGARRRKGRRPL
jgi:hypothetical protein